MEEFTKMELIVRWKGLVAVVALFLAGCAGTNFKWDDAYKIQPGMTEAEVIQILGKPYQTLRRGNETLLTWSYAEAFIGTSKAVTFKLMNGKVLEAIPPGMK